MLEDSAAEKLTKALKQTNGSRPSPADCVKLAEEVLHEEEVLQRIRLCDGLAHRIRLAARSRLTTTDQRMELIYELARKILETRPL